MKDTWCDGYFFIFMIERLIQLFLHFTVTISLIIIGSNSTSNRSHYLLRAAYFVYLHHRHSHRRFCTDIFASVCSSLNVNRKFILRAVYQFGSDTSHKNNLEKF
jgi:hypothetical protein